MSQDGGVDMPMEDRWCGMEAALGEVLEQLVSLHLTRDDVTLLPFYSSSVPAISIRHYLHRIVRYSSVPESLLVVSLIYLDRLAQQKHRQLKLNALNIHRLLLVSIMIATKFYSDIFYSNRWFAKLGGVEPAEINLLERILLSQLQFQLVVTQDEFSLYYNEIAKHRAPSMRSDAVRGLLPATHPLYSNTQQHHSRLKNYVASVRRVDLRPVRGTDAVASASPAAQMSSTPTPTSISSSPRSITPSPSISSTGTASPLRNSSQSHTAQPFARSHVRYDEAHHSQQTHCGNHSQQHSGAVIDQSFIPSLAPQLRHPASAPLSYVYDGVGYGAASCAGGLVSASSTAAAPLGAEIGAGWMHHIMFSSFSPTSSVEESGGVAASVIPFMPSTVPCTL